MNGAVSVMVCALDRRGITCVLDLEKRMGREPLDVSQKSDFVGFDIINVENSVSR